MYCSENGVRERLGEERLGARKIWKEIGGVVDGKGGCEGVAV